MSFDFELFGYNVSDYIIGEIKAHKVDDNVYSGIIVSPDGDDSDEMAYVLGLTVDDLVKMGYRSLEDLHILHSMNTAKTIEVLFLEGSSNVICFLITPNFLNLLRNDKALTRLWNSPDWKLYEIVSDEYGMPEDDYFLEVDDEYPDALGEPIYIFVSDANDFFEGYMNAFSEDDSISISDFYHEFYSSDDEEDIYGSDFVDEDGFSDEDLFAFDD